VKGIDDQLGSECHESPLDLAHAVGLSASPVLHAVCCRQHRPTHATTVKTSLCLWMPGKMHDPHLVFGEHRLGFVCARVVISRKSAAVVAWCMARCLAAMSSGEAVPLSGCPRREEGMLMFKLKTFSAETKIVPEKTEIHSTSNARLLEKVPFTSCRVNPG